LLKFTTLPKNAELIKIDPTLVKEPDENNPEPYFEIDLGPFVYTLYYGEDNKFVRLQNQKGKVKLSSSSFDNIDPSPYRDKFLYKSLQPNQNVTVSITSGTTTTITGPNKSNLKDGEILAIIFGVIFLCGAILWLIIAWHVFKNNKN
jgi:hypothetical protein